MARLSPADLRGRLKYDFEVIEGMCSPHLGPIQPFLSDRDLEAGVPAAPSMCTAGLARLYMVEYRFPILVGEGKTIPSVRAKFDLLAGGNYPFSPPTVTCIGTPLPWSPHFHPSSGLVCLGDGWSHRRGHMLAAQLIVHVARLLNFDEPERSGEYGGWNFAAANYWRTVLKKRPLNPDLEYPVLDARVTHGVDELGGVFSPVDVEEFILPGITFAPAQADHAFRPFEIDDDQDGFHPVER